jgi:hypothetical protein
MTSRRSSSLLRRSVAVLGSTLMLVAIVLASVDCYGPTEVTVALSTDLDCTDAPRTRIYKGGVGRYETTPEAEVSTCEPGNPDAMIGTLVVVPSGDRDGSAGVRIVLARNGKSPAECDSDPTNCIVATRAFSFVAHTSRRLPIRLVRDCLGVKCAEGDTCVAGGRCITDRVECASEDCRLPEEPPAPPPVPGEGGPPTTLGDASLDALPDVPLPDGADPDVPVIVPACVPTDGKDIATTTPDLPTMTATGTTSHFFVVDNSPVSVAVMQAPKKGPTVAPTVIFNQIAPAANEKPFALGVETNTALVTYGDEMNRAQAWNGTSYLAPVGMTKVNAISGIAAGRIALAGANGVVAERTSVAPFKTLLSATATSLANDGTYYYAATSSGITRIDPIPAIPATTPITGAPQNAILAGGPSGTVYAAAKDGSGPMMGIWRIAGNLAAATPLIGGRGTITSLASDATHVYWTEDDAIWRVGLTGQNPQKIFAQAGMSVRHVTVDAECLFFWTKRAAEVAALRFGPRRPFVTVGPGP